jgi:hypothetical protein
MRCGICLIILNCFFVSLKAQQFSFTIIDTTNPNASWYDIMPWQQDTFMAVGEQGLRALVFLQNNKWEVQRINLPKKATHIKLIAVDKKLISLGNHNTIIDARRADTVAYKNKNFSNYCGAYNNRQLLIGNVHSLIANGHKTIPRSTIYMLDTSFKNIKRQKFPFSAVWDIYNYNSNTFALKYGLRGTKLLQYNGHKFKHKQRWNYLWHKAFTYNNQMVYAGSKNYKLSLGAMLINNQLYTTKASGMIWDATISNNYVLGAGNNGLIIFKSPKQNALQSFKTPVNSRLYDFCNINTSTCFVVGQFGIAVVQVKD